MAKCIQLVGQGVPTRVTDAEAFQIVEREGDGQYCSKKFWRDWYAPSETFPDGRTPSRSTALTRQSANKERSNYLDRVAA